MPRASDPAAATVSTATATLPRLVDFAPMPRS
jgi:hypothetical protein